MKRRFAPDWHCDLMEQLSDYRACAAMSLNDIALALGLPGKIGGHGTDLRARRSGHGAPEARAWPLSGWGRRPAWPYARRRDSGARPFVHYPYRGVSLG